MSKAFLCNGCGDLVEGQPRLIKTWYNIDFPNQEMVDTSLEYCNDCEKKQKEKLKK